MARINYATETVWAGRKNVGNKSQPLWEVQMAAKWKLVSLQWSPTKTGKPMWKAILHNGDDIKVHLFNVSNIANHAGITIAEGDSPVFDKSVWIEIGDYDAQWKNFSRVEICAEVYQDAPAPETRPAPKDAKWHGETVTVFLANNKNRGGRDIWELQAMDALSERIRFTAWPEHNRAIIAAGFDSLPAYGFLGVKAMNVDVVLEAIDAVKGQYRISHVYKADGTLVSVDEVTAEYAANRGKPAQAETPITVIEKPVKVVIPVTIELTLEEELQVFYQDAPFTGYNAMMAIIRKHVDTERSRIESTSTPTTENESEAA